MDELVDRIRHAADQTGEAHFLELLRWHLVVAGLPDVDPTTHGVYRTAITDLGETRALELLADLRRLSRDPAVTGRALTGSPDTGKPAHSAGASATAEPSPH